MLKKGFAISKLLLKPKGNFYFTDTFKNDNWEKNNMKFEFFPNVNVISTPLAPFAKDLFRHSYNNETLGYAYVSLQKIGDILKKQKLPPTRDPQFLKELSEEGIYDAIVTDTIPEVYNFSLQSKFNEFIEYFGCLFTCHFKTAFGVVEINEAVPEKYNVYLNNIKRLGAALSPEGGSILFTQVPSFGNIGGWSIKSNNVGFSQNQFDLIQDIIEKQDIEEVVEQSVVLSGSVVSISEDEIRTNRLSISDIRELSRFKKLYIWISI